MPGGDLMIREKSSSSAAEHNMTAQFTQGKGDVQSPDVSFDGKKLVFSMRCPSSNTSKIADGSPACTGQWNIWEYDMTTGGLTRRHVPASSRSPRQRRRHPPESTCPRARAIVFTSNRQTDVACINQALGHSYLRT